ncbi:MAG TPA: hypothetical protein VNP72_07885, partial [Longimicrobium sp.]|nr:hypothetical protein [Longimicrobium sp.]
MADTGVAHGRYGTAALTRRVRDCAAQQAAAYDALAAALAVPPDGAQPEARAWLVEGPHSANGRSYRTLCYDPYEAEYRAGPDIHAVSRIIGNYEDVWGVPVRCSNCGTVYPADEDCPRGCCGHARTARAVEPEAGDARYEPAEVGRCSICSATVVATYAGGWWSARCDTCDVNIGSA